jgi:uncharacterized membrane protein YkvA (DUF1232 family)
MFWMWRLFRRVGGWRALWAQTLLAWRLLRDPRVPVKPKLVFPLAILYFVSPINLPFAWIPIVGQVDEVGIAMLALGAFLKLCPQSLVAEHARRLEAEFTSRSDKGSFGRYSTIVRPSFDRWTTSPSAGRPQNRKAA